MATKRQDRGTRGGGRFYQTADGTFPSVTNILSCIGKPALINWAASQERTYVTEAAASLYEDAPAAPKMSRSAFITSLQSRLSKEKAAEKAKREAAEIGTEVHKYIEYDLRQKIGQITGAPPALSQPAANAFAQWEAWTALVNLCPKRIEDTVWSKAFGFAGTMDMACELILPVERESVKMAFSLPSDMSLEAFFQQYNGQRVFAVADLKTSKRVYMEARLQVAAYAAALQEMGHERADLGLVIRLPKEEGQGFEVVPILNMDDEFRVFLHVLELWKRQQEFDKEAGWIKEEAV